MEFQNPDPQSGMHRINLAYWIVYQHVEANPPEIQQFHNSGILESGLCICLTTCGSRSSRDCLKKSSAEFQNPDCVSIILPIGLLINM